MAHLACSQSSFVGNRFLILTLRMFPEARVSKFLSTSATPNKPIASGATPMPSKRFGIPRVIRCSDVMGSRPTLLRRMPANTMITALSLEPWERYVMKTNPMVMMAKYSGGPNFKAILDSGAAMSCRPISPIVPAIKEPKAAIPRAGPARP